MSWITPITNWIASNVLTPTDMNRIEGNTQDLKDNKVDKITGKGLSTEDYTTTEKNKLAGIEVGATADQTASEIKTLYESNSNTNAFTDADKSKLAGMQTGAQVNTVTSVAGKTGAVAVTKSDVGLGSVENYGIATQGEAEAGTSDVKYMTPLKTKQAIGSFPASYNLEAAPYKVILTSSGTWTKPSGYKTFFIEIYGAGGGGGGGRRYSSNPSSVGRGSLGGGGGAVSNGIFSASELPSSVSYTIGAGGNGGTGGSSSGNTDGSTGGTTTFWKLVAPGGTGGYQGGLDTTTSLFGNTPRGEFVMWWAAKDETARTGYTAATVDTLYAGPVGGTGGNVTTSGTVTSGTSGGIASMYSLSRTPANSNGTNNISSRGPGTGGGGGPATTATQGGHGGTGGTAAGGGGGGNIRASSGSGGNGGKGGNGKIMIWGW